jgi:hypothetical protein
MIIDPSNIVVGRHESISSKHLRFRKGKTKADSLLTLFSYGAIELDELDQDLCRDKLLNPSFRMKFPKN